MTSNRIIKSIVKTAVTIYLICVSIFNSTGQSLAHQKSKFTIIDPCYSSTSEMPKSSIRSNSVTWIYGPSELECYRLQLLRQRKDSAKLKVGYPGNYHSAYKSASFILKLTNRVVVDTLEFRAVGHGALYLNHSLIGKFRDSDTLHTFILNNKTKAEEVLVDLVCEDDLPALLFEKPTLSTQNKAWKWKGGDEPWQAASHFPQNSDNVPPHKVEDPSIIIRPIKSALGLFDFGREIFGFIEVKSISKPSITVGESTLEALDTLNTILEQSSAMIKLSDGLWRSKSPLAFRYVYSANKKIDAIQSQAIFHPLTYKGAFACSDTLLTRIWMNSAYTLRMCMHDFILDGIKRDRLPWAGDMAMSMICNAYSFGDPELVRRSLVALGREGIEKKDINGIIDYSLWWIISQDNYQLYFGDSKHLNSEWLKIKQTLAYLSNRCDASGFLIPQKSWLFIDWVDQPKWSALQILWWWAQESGARLAHRTGDFKLEKQLQKDCDRLKNRLLKYSWNEKEQLWRSDSTLESQNTRHPNFLAVISGLASDDQKKGIKNLLENKQINQVGTPYMAGFENMALARIGNIQYMLDQVKIYWGGMLSQGATTFWEAYDPSQLGNKQYEYYNRPYAKSLCHAWSAGPAAFLPAEIVGLKPLEDGWKRFTVKPNMGNLAWITVTVPSKFGDIQVNIEKSNITIQIPQETTLEWKGRSIVGPQVIHDQL